MPEPNLLPLIVYPSCSFSPEIINEKLFKCKENAELRIDQNYMNMVEEFIKAGSNFFIDLDKVRKELKEKELPQMRRVFLKEKFGIKDETAFVFVANNLDHILIEILLKGNRNTQHESYDQTFAKLLEKILLNEYLNQVNSNHNLDKIEFKNKCKKIESYANLLNANLIGKRVKFKLFSLLFDTQNIHKLANELATEYKLFIVNDSELLENQLKLLFESNPKALSEYREKPKKREKIVEFFIRRMHLSFNDLADTDMVDLLVKNSLNNLLLNK
jgi:Asp-tRNA(Asn)/Glu-tRNA(Gln) amidotransferase B subunit